MADIVCKIIDRKAELEEQLSEMAYIRKEIEYNISLLNNPDHRGVLYKRYLEGGEWVDIAMEMGYSERQIYRLHASPLNEFVVPS
jgi:hypothetical protein